MAELLDRLGCFSDLALRRAHRNSSMLSSDVSAGYDPMYAEAFERKNCAYLGRGIVLNKFTGARGKSGSNDANAEYIARVRNVFDENSVAFQTAELGKVDFGGGGTIAYIAALYGMDVIDSGVAVLSMHAPWEVTSKADIYEALKAYEAFINRYIRNRVRLRGRGPCRENGPLRNAPLPPAKRPNDRPLCFTPYA